MNANKRTLMIVLAAVLVILGAGALAFVLSGGDDGGANGADGATPGPTDESPGAAAEGSAPGAAAPALAETRPIELTGDRLPALDDSAADPAVGQPLPVITGAAFDGTPMTIGGRTERPTMYVFLAHWCPHCNDEIPELLKLNERGGIPTGLDVVGISTAVAPDRANYPPSEWIVAKGWPWPVMADDEVSSSFVVAGGSGFPYTVLADADGNVIAREAGSRPADEIERWLTDHLAGVLS